MGTGRRRAAAGPPKRLSPRKRPASSCFRARGACGEGMRLRRPSLSRFSGRAFPPPRPRRACGRPPPAVGTLGLRRPARLRRSPHPARARWKNRAAPARLRRPRQGPMPRCVPRDRHACGEPAEHGEVVVPLRGTRRVCGGARDTSIPNRSNYGCPARLRGTRLRRGGMKRERSVHARARDRARPRRGRGASAPRLPVTGPCRGFGDVFLRAAATPVRAGRGSRRAPQAASPPRWAWKGGGSCRFPATFSCLHRTRWRSWR